MIYFRGKISDNIFMIGDKRISLGLPTTTITDPLGSHFLFRPQEAKGNSLYET